MLIDKIALILVIIGGINWGAVGIFKFDVVSAVFGIHSQCVLHTTIFRVFLKC